jgi:hypothetical protein
VQRKPTKPDASASNLARKAAPHVGKVAESAQTHEAISWAMGTNALFSPRAKKSYSGHPHMTNVKSVT